MKTPDLKVGARVTIVFENEINKSNTHYIKALVYDYDDDNIIISQTTPALNRHFLNRRIRVTFLAKVEKRLVRFGFRAQLIDVITDYEISSNKYVEALTLKQFGKPEQMDFRTHFRIKPPSQSRINLFFREEKINLIDISLGGAQFTYPKSYVFHRGDKIDIKLTIDDRDFDLKARVRNIFIPYEYSAHKSIQYVRIKFEYNNMHLETALGRAIIAIERKLLSEGKL